MRRLRVVSAHVVWVLCALAALVVAGAVLLVALKADAGHPVWGPWTRLVDSVLWGWFEAPDAGPLAGVDVQQTVIRWGAAALGLLAVGGVLQWALRPRRG